MKKFFVVMILAFATLNAYASGGITHMFMAERAISLLPDPDLRVILENNRDAYLVGAYYPDSGYIKGNTYGEVSHWDPFINAFVDYIKKAYPNPSISNPKLVAFLFGVAAHRVSDEITHWKLYPYIENNDFSGDNNKTQEFADLGIDLLLTVDQSLWNTQPNTWWVPVKDLLAVYNNMGVKDVNKEQIEYGNKVLSLAGYGERIIAPPAYLVLQWKMPWTSGHYYSWEEGGVLMDEQRIAMYQTKLWARLQDFGPRLNEKKNFNMPLITHEQPIQSFAEEVITDNIITVKQNDNDDGSVTLQPPVVQAIAKFNSKIKLFLSALISKI